MHYLGPGFEKTFLCLWTFCIQCMYLQTGLAALVLNALHVAAIMHRTSLSGTQGHYLNYIFAGR